MNSVGMHACKDFKPFLLTDHGSTYVRWGRTQCEGINTELVYSGNVCTFSPMITEKCI